MFNHEYTQKEWDYLMKNNKKEGERKGDKKMEDNYIRMCKEAKPIQETWTPKDGDMILYEDKIGFIKNVKELPHFIIEDSITRPVTQKEAYYLPRQEDLQQYFMKANYHVSTVVNMFNDWFWEKYNNKQESCLNQYDWNVLWLCFVMETVYNKRWDREQWKEL